MIINIIEIWNILQQDESRFLVQLDGCLIVLYHMKVNQSNFFIYLWFLNDGLNKHFSYSFLPKFFNDSKGHDVVGISLIFYPSFPPIFL